MLKDLIIKHNISEQIKEIKEPLMKQCLEQRHTLDTAKTGNTFVVESKYTNFLYNIFYQISNMNLNKFNIRDLNFKLWCYLTDEKFHDQAWHNHVNTTTINSVLYLKTQNKGIFFRHQDEEIHIIPEEGDMLIFPSFLYHLPEVSKTKPRITLNLELRCTEPAERIFKKWN